MQESPLSYVEDIIGHVVQFMSATDAARVMVLNRAWFASAMDFVVQRCGHRILLYACKHGSIDYLKFLLQDERIDPRACDSEALTVSVAARQTQAVDVLLLDGRCDPSARNNEAVHIACRDRDIDCIALLMRDARVNLRLCGDEILIAATLAGRYDVISQLLVVDGYRKWIPTQFLALKCSILLACFNKRTDIIRLLIQDERLSSLCSAQELLRIATLTQSTSMMLLLQQKLGISVSSA